MAAQCRWQVFSYFPQNMVCVPATSPLAAVSSVGSLVRGSSLCVRVRVHVFLLLWVMLAAVETVTVRRQGPGEEADGEWFDATPLGPHLSRVTRAPLPRARCRTCMFTAGHISMGPLA